MRFIDLTGKKFGRLTVVSRAESKAKHTMWNCKCECGNTSIVYAVHLKRGRTKSCGCLHNEILVENSTTHGLSNNRINKIYRKMKGRCYNSNDTEYKRYGARGITICNEWLNDFMSFYNWAMANGYSDNLSIDRINVNGNYEPSNCRWATDKQQANNKRNNRQIKYNGKIYTLSQLAEELNLNYKYLYVRLYRSNWDIYKALNTTRKE